MAWQRVDPLGEGHHPQVGVSLVQDAQLLEDQPVPLALAVEGDAARDIGNVVALLCSPDAGWITGQLIYADGGASLADTLLPLEVQRG